MTCRIIFMLMCLFACLPALKAQDSTQDSIQTKNRGIVVYEPKTSTSATSGKSNKTQISGNSQNNIMKYSVFGFSNGSHMLFYERNLVGGFSVEAGLGITFKDVLGSFFESYFNRGIEKSEHRYAHGVPFEEFEDYRRTVMGNSYSIFVRKYFGENYGDHLSGLYVGLGFDQRSHYSEVSESYWQERGIVLSTFNPEREVRRVSNFTAVVGTQAYFSSTVTYDAAVYVGYRQTVNNFVRNHETLTSGQSPDEQFYMEERNFSGLTVMFTLKAGFAF